MEQGYSFVWPADGKPYFIRPHLGVIELNVDGRVPVIDASCKVLNSREFRKDCNLLRLFAMVSARAAEAEEEGVDEGVVPDSETDYIRSRKASDLEKEASSREHQFCHYPKKSILRSLPEGAHDGAARKEKGRAEKIGYQKFWGSHCS